MFKSVTLIALVAVFGMAFLALPADSFGKPRAKKIAALRKLDTDRDYLTDYRELRVFKTNPRRKDSDRNGIKDGEEDRDRDGIANEDEDDLKRLDKDTDHDGLSDEDEDEWGLKVKNPDSDGDGVLDGDQDSDGNGIANEDEDDRMGELPSIEDDNDQQIGSTETPTTTPSPIPSPGSGGNFDSEGNTIMFGIPSGLVGNIIRGRDKYQDNCLGCHVERTNRTFPMLLTAITTVPAMGGFRALLSDHDIADMTAFLNRFNQ